MALGSFTAQLGAFEKKANERAKVVPQRIAMEAWARVIEKSPVGNPDKWQSPEAIAWAKKVGYVGGRFRANWGVSIGSPFAGHDEAARDTRQIGDRTGPTVFKTAVDTKQWNGQGSIFLCNNTVYSLALERGHSQIQAPLGIVGRTAAEMANGIAEQIAKGTI